MTDILDNKIEKEVENLHLLAKVGAAALAVDFIDGSDDYSLADKAMAKAKLRRLFHLAVEQDVRALCAHLLDEGPPLPVYPSVDAYAAHLFGRGEA